MISGCIGGKNQREENLAGGKLEFQEEEVKNAPTHLTEVNGSLAYVGRKNNYSFVVHEGKRVSKKYHKFLGAPIDVNGKVTYTVTNMSDNPVSFIKYGDKKVGEEYRFVSAPTEVGGELTYKVHKEGN